MGRIGAMRHRLVIEARDAISDSGGGQTVSWSSGATVWAEITPLSGGELLRQDRLSATITHRISLRYRSDVAPEMRFRSGERLFEILTVRDVDERHRRLECLCEEKYL